MRGRKKPRLLRLEVVARLPCLGNTKRNSSRKSRGGREGEYQSCSKLKRQQSPYLAIQGIVVSQNHSQKDNRGDDKHTGSVRKHASKYELKGTVMMTDRTCVGRTATAIWRRESRRPFEDLQTNQCRQMSTKSKSKVNAQ
jgi:hypothetical protein